MSGAAATDAERQALIARIPINRLLQNDGEDFLRLATADMQTQVSRTVGRELQAFTTELSPQEAATIPPGTPLGTFGAAEVAEGKALRERDATKLVEDRYTNTSKNVRDPNADITNAKGEATPAWRDFVRAAKRSGAIEKAIGNVDADSFGSTRDYWSKNAENVPPKFATDMEYLVKEANSSDEKDAKRAQKELSGLIDDPALGYRANYLQYLLNNNPPRNIYLQDDPDTTVDESNLLREPVGTGVLDFPD
jgi:hypothetical protein